MGAVGITLSAPLSGVHFSIAGTQCDSGSGIAFCAPVAIGDHVVSVSQLPEGVTVEGTPRAVVVAGQNTEIIITLRVPRPPTPAFPLIPFAGRIRVDGKVFRDESGQIWTWRFATEFLLLNDLLDGRDITPILDDPDRGLVALGANGVRVIGMAHWIPINERRLPEFRPATYGDRYFEALGELADLLRARGLYLEFTALADTPFIMPAVGDQRAFLEKVAGVLSSKPNAFLEYCNEPYDTDNRCGDVLALGRVPGAVLQASGNYDVRELADRYVLDHVMDYVTEHPPRDEEWARKSHDAMDLRDGFSNNGKDFAGVQVPVVADEPQKAGDDANVALFREFAASSALFGSGATFHSFAGVATKPFTDRQRDAARGFFAGLKAVAGEAQLWRYNRGGLTGMPLAHSDDLALRSFAKMNGNDSYVVVIGPRPGWALIEENGYHCTALVPEGDVLRCQR